jgi:peptidoglycan/LPS O-acetylase OafA/YrhL
MRSLSSSVRSYEPGRYQPALDGLRAISILGVLLYHCEGVLPGGSIGVDVFFVLSGFLITSLLCREWQVTGAIGLRRFYARRALRLFPALGALLGLFVLGALFRPDLPQSPKILRAASYAALYVANWAQAYDPTRLHIFIHTWSLAVEEQFYVLWPILLISLLRRTGLSRTLVYIVGGMALCSALWRAWLYQNGVQFWRLYVGTDTRADSLLIGCALALAMLRGDLDGVLVRHATRLRLLGGASLALLAWIARTSPLESPSRYMGVFFLIALAAAVIVVCALSYPAWIVSRVLSWAPLVWIGRLSYSLYLWHLPIFRLVQPGQFRLPLPLLLPTRLALALAASVGSHYLIERPFLRLKDRVSTSQRPELVEGTSTGASTH